MERVPAVYIVASQKRGTVYTGVTSDPIGRMIQYRQGITKGFVTKYGATRLVLIEFFGDMENAIKREKQIKAWRRAWKINLIEATNPSWRDLALDYGLDPLSTPRWPRLDPETSSG
jgi:putative endonuclease